MDGSVCVWLERIDHVARSAAPSLSPPLRTSSLAASLLPSMSSQGPTSCIKKQGTSMLRMVRIDLFALGMQVVDCQRWSQEVTGHGVKYTEEGLGCARLVMQQDPSTSTVLLYLSVGRASVSLQG